MMTHGLLRKTVFRVLAVFCAASVLFGLLFAFGTFSDRAVKPSSAAAPTRIASNQNVSSSPKGSHARARTAKATAQANPLTVCQSAFKGKNIFSWAKGTAGMFRAYQYGSAPTRPLKDAFAGIPDSTAGAWCSIVVAGPDATGSETLAFYAVIPGQQPQPTVTITGVPGDSAKGEVSATAFQVPGPAVAGQTAPASTSVQTSKPVVFHREAGPSVGTKIAVSGSGTSTQCTVTSTDSCGLGQVTGQIHSGAAHS